MRKDGKHLLLVLSMYLFVWLVSSAGQATAGVLNVTAGTVEGISGDTTADAGVTFQLFDGDSSGVGHMVLDLGSVQNIDEITIVNRQVDTLLNVDAGDILIAPDELAGGFNPLNASSFTQSVFSGQFSPFTIAGGALRSANITDSARRYFLIDITSNFNGALSSTNEAHFSDVQVTVVPEPASLVLMGLGGLLMIVQRR